MKNFNIFKFNSYKNGFIDIFILKHLILLFEIIIISLVIIFFIFYFHYFQVIFNNKSEPKNIIDSQVILQLGSFENVIQFDKNKIDSAGEINIDSFGNPFSDINNLE